MWNNKPQKVLNTTNSSKRQKCIVFISESTMPTEPKLFNPFNIEQMTPKSLAFNHSMLGEISDIDYCFEKSMLTKLDKSWKCNECAAEFSNEEKLN